MAQPQVVDLESALLAAQDTDANVRQQAEQQLAQFKEQNYAGFLASLSSELSNNAKRQEARQLAGLLLKNALDAKDEVRKHELQAQWLAVDAQLRASIKAALLSTLHTEPANVRHTAALVIAKVAAVELPRNEWPDLISSLLTLSQPGSGSVGLRQSTLESLGYVCEEMAMIKEEILNPEQVNQILTAVVRGMTSDNDAETRLAATTALCNAVEFANHNFDNDNERNYIMQVVCDGTVAPDVRVRQASFQCLHEIAGNYYAKLPQYMDVLYQITVKAIKEDDEEVSLQAIEFWCTVCDYEIDLEEEGDQENENHEFIKKVCPHLVPVLLELLTKQEEGQEQDETIWNASMAGGTCLGLMARAAGTEIVGHVMPFVQANISRNTTPEDWRLREAATFAFGSILEGPEESILMNTVASGHVIPFLVVALKDTHPHVKDTTAWTLGRIFEFLHTPETPIITKEMLPNVVQALLESLKDEVHIAYRVCCAIGFLAAGFRSTNAQTSDLSPFFNDMMHALLVTAGRDTGGVEHNKLQLAAFEAINELVRSSVLDTLETVAKLIPLFVDHINRTFEMPVASGEAREKQAELQAQLCGVLQVIVQRLSDNDTTKAFVMQYADHIMACLLRIFSNNVATVHEEAMLAVGAFTYACGKHFSKYMQDFYPFLKMGLQNYQEWQVCLSTVGVLGDVCRNIEEQILPNNDFAMCDDIMLLLVQNLGREDVHRNVKPHILSSFGDIALVIGENFEKYVDSVKKLLQQAMHVSAVQGNTQDEDFLDYNNELRNGIFDAYSGIFQGLGRVKCELHMKPEVPIIVQFLNAIANEPSLDTTVAKSGINLLGDICSIIQNAGALINSVPDKSWTKLLYHCKQPDVLGGDTDWGIIAVEQAVGPIS